MQNTLSFTNAKLSKWTDFFGISEVDSCGQNIPYH